MVTLTMNDLFYKQVKQAAKSADRIFYMISADNLQLKQNKEREIINYFATTLGFE